MKVLLLIYYCLQGKGAHKQWYRNCTPQSSTDS